MLKSGLLDEDMLYNLSGTDFIWQWDRWGPLIKEARIRAYGDLWMEDLEYLADRMRKVQKRRNIIWENPFK
jgi:hypothetical protein